MAEFKTVFTVEDLKALACPACHGELRLAGEAIVCGGCGRSYPLIDGIPVLIAERASGPESIQAE